MEDFEEFLWAESEDGEVPERIVSYALFSHGLALEEYPSGPSDVGKLLEFLGY